MSNSSQKLDLSEPSNSRVLLSALAWMGVFGVFVVIVLITYGQTPSVDVEEVNAEERLSIRNEVEATQTRLVDAYEWVNQTEGVVRIPVERAEDLVLSELEYAPEGRQP